MEYGQLYDKKYYETSCGKISYLELEHWVNFFGIIADSIIESIHPKIVLDVGCAFGYLVAALRDRGIEAYGIDVSEYAISKVREDVKPYCKVCSALDPLPKEFPQKYDLVTTIEVAEHLYEEDGKIFIKNICNYADDIIFSSTPDDITEKTHFNVQQSEYWAKIFAENGFFKELTYNASYISPQASRFVKHNLNQDRVVENYERAMRILKNEYMKNSKESHSPIKCTFNSKIYYDTGKGYNENEGISFKVENGKLNQDIHLPIGVKSIRFDPVEGDFCVVKNIEVVTNNGVIKPVSINSLKIDEFCIFESTDPQYIIDFQGKSTQWVKLRASIQIVQEMDMQLLLSKFHQITTLNEKTNKLQEEMQEVNLQKDQATQEVLRQKKILQETLKKETELCEEIDHYRNKYNDSINQMMELQNEIEQYKAQYNTAVNERAELSNKLGIIQEMYQTISNSTCWRITKPIRMFLDFVKKLINYNNIGKLFYKVLDMIKKKGFKYTFQKIKKKINKYKKLNITVYRLLGSMDKKQEAFQRQYSFKNLIKISIIVPTYQTKKEYLKDLVNSVRNQTYANWELCIADGHSDLKTVRELKKLCKNDSKIKVKFLTENKGIAGNTIEAYSISSGDYIVLLDHDDILSKDALFEVVKCVNEIPNVDFIYSDRAVFSDKTKKIIAFHYFPGYSPEYLKSCNDTSHLTAFSRKILDKVGFEREGYDGSQDYDLELRVTEKTQRIANIQKVLYFCRACEGSVALNPESKYYAYEAGRKAISEHIANIGYPGQVEFLEDTFSYRIRYDILKRNKISIIIPNNDHANILKRCIDSILQKTNYENYEIVIIENNSTCSKTFDYYDSLKNNNKISILYYPEKEFNFSAINNWAVKRVKGDIILLLNNDVEVITKDWLTEMLMYTQMNDVGAVGAVLLYPNNTFQHTGLFIGLGGHIASAYDHGKSVNEKGYMRRLVIPQNYCAVTAACLMVKKEDYIKVGGLDDRDFKIGLNDIDFCLKLREIGKRNVVTPYAKLYHYESVSRGTDEEGKNKERFLKECNVFRKKWKKYFEYGDPYLNRNM